MNKKFIILLILIALALIKLASAFSGNGTGTLADPFAITNCSQLQEMNNSISANYTLSNNIDCSDTINWNSGQGFSPITTTYNGRFLGSLKGQGYNITGLYINRASTNNGLFGYTGASANITNFSMIDANYNGTSYMGGVVAYNYGSVSYVSFEGDIFGTTGEIGGIVGVNDGPISYCYARGNFTATSSGMIGGVFGDSIDSKSAVSNCYAEGSVTGAGQGVAGFAGRNYGTISNSYSKANATSTNTNIGGFTGTNYGTISSSYSMGKVTGGNPYYTCGFADTSGSVSACYHDSQTGLAYYTGSYCSRTEKTTAQMLTPSTYSGWNFATIWNNDSSWNDGYPFLIGVGNMSPSRISVSILFPLSGGNYSSLGRINYSATSAGTLDSCWYSNSSGAWNSSSVAARINFTSVSVANGQNNFTVYCNTSNNIGNSSVSFQIDLIPPAFTNLSNQTLQYKTALAYTLAATDSSAVSCFTVNDTTNFNINCSGYLKNNTLLSAGLYMLNVSVNDTLNNLNSGLMFVNVTPGSSIVLSMISPAGNMNATQNRTFTVSVNVSCLYVNCGQINVSLDPSSNIVTNGNFETGSLTGWTTGGNANWAVQTTTKNESSYGAKAGTITSSQNTWITQNVTLAAATNLTFSWKVSSESGWDYLGYCIDKSFGDSGCTRGAGNVTAISGTVGWTLVRVIVPTGTHKLLWYYAKDGSVDTGSDTGWLDNVTILGNTGKAGLVNTTIGATPFYTTTQNPYNISLNVGESQIVTWTVNATGAINSTYAFFIYANATSDMSVGNVTPSWNITIVNDTVDSSAPTVSIAYPANNTNYSINMSSLNYTASDDSSVNRCWYSNSSGVWNSTSQTPGENWTQLNSAEGWNNWTVYCNDTLGNIGSSLIIFFKDTILPEFTAIENQTLEYNHALAYQISADDSSAVSCFTVNDTTNFNINCSGYLESILPFSVGLYWINITVNDTLNNLNSAVMWVNATASESPNSILNNPPETYNNDTANYYNITFNCSATDTYGLSNISLYITNSSSQNFALNQTSVITGLSNFTNWTVQLASGVYTWNCLVYDSDNNSDWAENRSIVVNFTDSDGDSIPNSLDRLEGTESSVNGGGSGGGGGGSAGGISDLNVTISGNSTSGSFDDIQEIVFYDSTKEMINFTHNFTASELDLSKIIIVKAANSIIVNLSAQLQSNYNKTMYIDDNDFASLCVKDAEISSISEISSGCTGASETDFTSCLNGGAIINGISCIDEGAIIRVENLRYSAIRGTPRTASSSSTSSSSGGAAYECEKDSSCKQGYVCYNHKCSKLFDIKILSVKSPINPKEFFNFTYYMKGMAEIKGDVIINFWLEKAGRKITEGQDTIYLGTLEEKTEASSLFLPSKIENGVYRFYIRVSYENYKAESYKDIEVIRTENGAEVRENEESPVSIDKKSIKINIKILLAVLLSIALLLLLPRIIRLARKIKLPKLKLPVHCRKKENTLANQMSKRVYTSNGNFLGTVEDVYIENYRIYGWLIRVNSDLSKELGKKRILVRHAHINSVSEAIILDQKISDYLEKFR